MVINKYLFKILYKFMVFINVGTYIKVFMFRMNNIAPKDMRVDIIAASQFFQF